MTMRIQVRLGEPFWRTVGTREVSLELTAPATVACALAALQEKYPALRPDLEADAIPPTVIVGEEIALPEMPLSDGAQLLLVWALAGG